MKRKVAELHRKIERERDRKQKMYQSASEALIWWGRTNALAEKIMKQSLGVIQIATGNRLKLMEWFMICPFKWIGRLAEWLMKLFNKKDIWLDTAIYEAQFQRWQVQRLLGDAKSYTVEEMAGKLEVPVAVIEEILKEIMEEKDKNGLKEEATAPQGKVSVQSRKTEPTIEEKKQRILRETESNEEILAPESAVIREGFDPSPTGPDFGTKLEGGRIR